MRNSAFGCWDCALLFHHEAVLKRKLQNHHQLVTVVSDSTARILGGKSYIITMQKSSSKLTVHLNILHLSSCDA